MTVKHFIYCMKVSKLGEGLTLRNHQKSGFLAPLYELMKTGCEAKSCLSVSATYTACKDRQIHMDSQDERTHTHTHTRTYKIRSSSQRLSAADHLMAAGRISEFCDVIY